MARCPNCVEHALDELTDTSGVVFDLCGKCRGVWLDPGELSRLLNRPAAEGLLDFKQGSRACVRCSKPMLRGSFINKMLVVDRCAPCGGVWLDASELRVVRQLLGVTEATGAESARPAPAPRSAAPQPAGPPVPGEPGYQAPAAPPAGAGVLPAAPGSVYTPSRSTTPPVESWQWHAGFWLVLGVGTLVYGKKRMTEWQVITAAGGLMGAAPEHIMLAGMAMTAMGVVFLFKQPAHASEGYLAAFKLIFSPRRRYYGGRYNNHWYR